MYGCDQTVRAVGDAQGDDLRRLALDRSDGDEHGPVRGGERNVDAVADVLRPQDLPRGGVDGQRRSPRRSCRPATPSSTTAPVLGDARQLAMRHRPSACRSRATSRAARATPGWGRAARGGGAGRPRCRGGRDRADAVGGGAESRPGRCADGGRSSPPSGTRPPRRRPPGTTAAGALGPSSRSTVHAVEPSATSIGGDVLRARRRWRRHRRSPAPAGRRRGLRRRSPSSPATRCGRAPPARRPTSRAPRPCWYCGQPEPACANAARSDGERRRGAEQGEDGTDGTQGAPSYPGLSGARSSLSRRRDRDDAGDGRRLEEASGSA